MSIKPIFYRLATLFILFFCIGAGAQVTVRAFAKPVALSPLDTFEFIVSIESETPNQDIGSPKLPFLNHFKLLSESQSSSIQTFNFKFKSTKTYTYILKPLQEGIFTIGAVELIVGGVSYKTSPVKIEVSSNIKPRQKKPSRRGSLFNPFFSPFSPSRPSKEVLSKEDIFITREIEKNKLYVRELLLIPSFVYAKGDVVVNVEKKPKMDGFWVMDQLNIAGNRAKSVDVKGKTYIKKLFHLMAVFPVRKGVFNIDPLTAVVRAHAGFSFFSSYRSFKKDTSSQQLEVVSLPKKPDGMLFTEAVGDFDILASLSKTSGSMGKPLVYEVLVKGQGHPQIIQLPSLDFGDAFEVYDITESQEFSITESFKKFEVILIPNSPGNHKIPVFELATFDPLLGIYKTHILPSFSLNITDSVSKSEKQKAKVFFETEGKKDNSKKINNSTETEEAVSVLSINTMKKWFIRNGQLLLIIAVSGVIVILLAFLFIKTIIYGNKKNLLNKEIKAWLKRVDACIQSKKWTEAGVEMNDFLFWFFMKLSGKETQLLDDHKQVIKNWSHLIENIPVSIRIQYEKKIKQVIADLEKLSFASFHEGRVLRNKATVNKLKKDILYLLKNISLQSK